MAEVTGHGEVRSDAVLVHQWAGLGNGDTGKPISLKGFERPTVQVVGTFGTGGTVDLEGSNDGSNWFALTDHQGNAVSLTAGGAETFHEYPELVRPKVSDGDATTDVDVHLSARKPS